MLLSKLPPGVCWRGEGGATGFLHGLVTKQQAVEFLQVQTSNYNNNKQESYVIKLIGVYKDSKLLNSDRN